MEPASHDRRQRRRQGLSRRAFLAEAALGSFAVAVAGVLAACHREPARPAAAATPPAGTAQSTRATPRPGTTAGIAPPAPATRGAETAPIPPAGVAWLREHALPFATAQPGGGLGDLRPFGRIVGVARLVALGEATHGTHEFSTMKHRLLEFLVLEAGFTVFAIEAGWAEAERLDDWVRTGRGDPVDLLAELRFWSVNTQEVLDLLRWMRAYNVRAGAAGAVGFHGLDMQFAPPAIADVLAYVRQVAPADQARFTAWYAPFQGYAAQPALYRRAGPDATAPGRDGVLRAYAELGRRRGEYAAASSDPAFTRALQSARIVVQAEALWSAGSATEEARARDRFLAENAGRLLEEAGPAAKMALWAHNAHVGALPYGSGAESVPSMGGYLRDRYHAALLSCGFDFYAGSFVAVGGTGEEPRVYRASPAPPDSYEAAFRQADLPRMILDQRDAPPDSPGTAWLTGPRRFRQIGAGYDVTRPDDSYIPVSLPRQFDVVISFQDTSPSHPLFPFGPPADSTGAPSGAP